MRATHPFYILYRATVITVLGIAAAFAAPLARATTIVVYGASGAIGGVIVQEALNRGDTVIGVSRDPTKLKFQDAHFKAVSGDITDLVSFKSITRGADAVIISVGGNGKDNSPENSTAAVAARIAVKAYTGRAQSPHVIQIGGATTMYETKAEMAAHSPFPVPPGSSMYGNMFGHLVALQTYRRSSIRWTVLTPPWDIEGWSQKAPPVLKRTGKYRTSTTGFVLDASGRSALNIADLAVAAVDEAEHPRFVRKRFTVGY